MCLCNMRMKKIDANRSFGYFGQTFVKNRITSSVLNVFIWRPRESWRFTVSPNVRFRMSCPLVHVPRNDNNIRFTILDSRGRRINRVTFTTGENPEARVFQRGEILDSTVTVMLQLTGSNRPNHLGRGLLCVVSGVDCGSSPPPPPPTPSPPTPAPPTPAPPTPLSCGMCAGSRKTKIINGNFANNDKYCFMVRLHNTGSCESYYVLSLPIIGGRSET